MEGGHWAKFIQLLAGVLLITSCIAGNQGSTLNCTDRFSCGRADADCEANEWRCGDGTCIESWQFCDFREDCPDGSDESRCGRYKGADVTTVPPPNVGRETVIFSVFSIFYASQCF
ncbi:low-density lipoprotein receptor-like [Ptychodera flava]|uniref:low-density lipoprotein receptor-like n=1 Tax=Ptychodera flava TaxID=63121 RepID=UPI00396A8D2C